jgi:hypothetical protein
VSHFSNLFSSTRPPITEEMLSIFYPAIPKEDNLLLCSIPPESEVVQAFSNLGSTKASGPDGFTALFFKKYWSVFKLDVLNYTRHYFQNQQQQIGSHFVHHFRPISLCNISYKIITKILANRLKSIPPKIISLFNMPLFPPKISKTISFLHMSFCTLTNSKKGKEASCFSTWIWKKPLLKWSGFSFCLLWRSLVFTPPGSTRLDCAFPLLLSPSF